MKIRLQVGTRVRILPNGRWRTINYTKIDKNGDQWICVGIEPFAFTKAEDAEVYTDDSCKYSFNKDDQEKAKIDLKDTLSRIGSTNTSLTEVEALLLDGLMDKDMNTFCNGLRMFMNE